MFKSLFNKGKVIKERISEEDAEKLERIRLRIKMLIRLDAISVSTQQDISELIDAERSIVNRYRDIRGQIIITKHDINRLNKMHAKRARLLDIINSGEYYGNEILTELCDISRREYEIIQNLSKI